jgi:transposase
MYNIVYLLGEVAMTLNPGFQVPVPKKGVIIAKSGRYPYVHKVLKSYRNEKGQPTNDKVSIGKLDPKTGMLIPNDNYHKYYGPSPTQVVVGVKHEDGETFDVGVPFITSRIFSSLGLDQVLDESLGAFRAERAKTVVGYMLSEGNVMSYLSDYCQESLLSGGMTDKDASRLFASIGGPERMRFFKAWVELRRQKEYFAYDVTSFSSYAEGISDTEWGYNRDGESLPQINMGMFIGSESRLPIFYTIYPGSITDKSHLKSMMEYNDDLKIKDITFVMDKGFASTANFEYMRQKGYPFIVTVENRTKAFKEALHTYYNDIQSDENYIDDLEVYGMGIKGRYFGVASTLHIFYDVERLSNQLSDMNRKIKSEEEELTQKSSLTASEIKKFSKHFIIKHDGNGSNIRWVRNHDAINIFKKDLGYYSILTNSNLSSFEINKIYKKRNKIEDCFDNIKNHIDMKRLRTHNLETTAGKMFCAFVTLIIRMEIEIKVHDWAINNRFTMKKIIREFNKIRAVIGTNGARMLNPLTKKQREILALFDATEADVLGYIKAEDH